MTNRISTTMTRKSVSGGRAAGAGVASLALLAGLAGPASAHPVAASTTAVVADAIPVPPPTGLVVAGRGYGHGRGLGQYGALGYASNHNWSSARILNHYYGGTTAGSVGNPTIGVELLAWSGRSSVTLKGSALKVNGRSLRASAVRFTRDRDGNFTIYRASTCGGPWAKWSRTVGASISSSVVSSNPNTYIQTCGSTGSTRGYRGTMWVGANSSRSMRVVNRVPVDIYLRGVLPREMPASWANVAGGKGVEALKAQAVAARSYALASKRASYAQTCDTTACQVYGGAFTRSSTGTVAWLEDSRSNTAVSATSGLVRRKASGATARTEFSSSTGGYSAGGDFPAVADAGDAVGSNPNRAWSRSFTWADVEAKIGRGKLTSLAVTKRNGLGADGGRVLAVVATTATGSKVTLTGDQMRLRFGLKSNWFALTVQQPKPVSTGSFSATTASSAVARAALAGVDS